MIRRLLVALAVLFALTLASESPFLGKIALKPLGKDTPSQVIPFRPLSQQPKIANLKNNEVELTFVSDLDSCKILPTTLTSSGALMAVIDVSTSAMMSCGLNIKKNRLKQAGFKGFLLASDSQNLEKSFCHMLDDSQFLMGTISTGTFQLISKYNEAGSKDTQKFQIKGLLTIQLFNSSLKLLQVWTSSLNANTYETIQLLGRSMAKLATLEAHVQWTPRIASYDCVHAESAQICANSLEILSCGCKGEFCSPQTRQKTPVPLIKQDMRQLLIFRQHYSKYFSYMSNFKQQCLAIYQREKYVDQCASTVMESLKIDSFSINEVIDTFLDQCVQSQQIKQSALYATLQKDQKAFASYGRYPLLLINKEPIDYRTEDDFNGVLCSKLQLSDPACFTIVQEVPIIASSSSLLFFLLLILSLVLIGAAVVYCYRKKLKREMNKQIKMQVSTAVEHYFALTETSSAK